MKVAFLTLGCKVNKYETDLLKEKFEMAGHFVVDFEAKADVYCINSCSVTNMSDRKTRQMVSRARKQNPAAIVAVVGCSVQSNNEQDAFLDADIVLGNDEKMELLEVVQNFKKKEGIRRISLQDISEVKRYKEVGNLNKGYDLREAIKIEDGCDNFCSYCIIPYIRGRVRSRNLDSIKKEAENLVRNGVKELVLVGIEVASYGKDLENADLFNVLDMLDKIEGLDRIRLSSMEPRFLSTENILKLAKYKKLCPHFHISMQSGNNDVLKRMNRKYTKQDLIRVCSDLRKHFEDPYIASDVIVGFPGETDVEFEDTVNTINDMKLCEIHVFKYSKRKYTRAAKMEGQVDGTVKKNRSNIILKLSKKLNQEFLGKYIGRKVKVLFENYTDGILTGFTPNYIKVKTKGDNRLCGTIQDVVITSLEKDIALGSLD
ncbi:MAG: tRNA (N(6)-L-threonylcarbamoyladenosine(37)-C(2))-methylthiotransferase MtaB [Clostridia bacterium]|nr:tRNA (N(6)-L-threonylcarbamoyladenosine(37)-C(2))-methylthiotransferase MtaB [Clostridia bacterium]